VIVVALACVLAAAPALHASQWADEFNGSGAVDSSIWSYDTGAGGWGNNELENYTNSTTNVNQAGGALSITARCCYTSGRIKTQGKRTFQMGDHVEARLRGPNGQGFWPAFWALGANIATVPWPGCGEIDIMEHINNDQKIYATLHWAAAHSGRHTSASLAQPAVADYNAYHTYGLVWDATSMTEYLDGVAVGSTSISTIDTFHKSFFMLLNLAVGGGWPGNPDGTTVFPANYNIDYVRFYSTNALPSPTATVTPMPTATPTATPIGTNLALGKPATASSVEAAGLEAANAVDGNAGTRWGSAFSDPQWISVDLGVTRSITGVRLNWEAAYASSYSIQVSNDNATWTTVKSVTRAKGGLETWTGLSGSGRYVRMYGTRRATQYGDSLWEFEIYGN
jgi:beta-glucanase (GH16 family)